jgi:hypothetical protein
MNDNTSDIRPVGAGHEPGADGGAPAPEPGQAPPQGRAGALGALRRVPLWAWASGLGVLLAAAVVVAILGGGPGPTPPRGAPPAEQQNATQHADQPVPGADQPALPYEEPESPVLERSVRQVDFALLETLLFTGYDPHAMTIRETRLETRGGEHYHFQIVDIELENGPGRFLDILARSLAKWAPEATLAPGEQGAYVVSVAGVPTHVLEFATAAPLPAPPGPPAEGPATGGALLAVVIDDMGQDLRFARELAALPFPVTFSILPGTPHNREVAALAAKSGREVLLHLPMEPKGWPGINPGPGALFTFMAPDEMRRVLAADLDEVPGAVGVNNHMGSRFTGHADGMAVVLDELRARGLFFLDSLTARGSTAVGLARDMGLPVYRRSVFLDNIRDVGAITRQMEKAARAAAATGQAVAIGHPYPETLAALRQWAQRENSTVSIVHLKRLKPLN